MTAKPKRSKKSRTAQGETRSAVKTLFKVSVQRRLFYIILTYKLACTSYLLLPLTLSAERISAESGKSAEFMSGRAARALLTMRRCLIPPAAFAEIEGQHDDWAERQPVSALQDLQSTATALLALDIERERLMFVLCARTDGQLLN